MDDKSQGKPKPQDSDEPLREQDVTSGDRLDDRLSEDELPEAPR